MSRFTREVLAQGPGWSIAVDHGPRTHFPMAGHVRIDGSVVHDSLDLRDRPELAGTVPEAAECDGLRRLLAVANATGSHLMSIGCGYWGDPAIHGKSVSGYADLAFRDQALACNWEAYIELAARIRQLIPPPEQGIFFRIDMEAQGLGTFFGASGCYALSLGAQGNGEPHAQAVRSFSAAMASYAEALGQALPWLAERIRQDQAPA